MPTYRDQFDAGIWGPCRSGRRRPSKNGQMLMNIARFGRGKNAPGDVAVQHPAGVRRQRRRAGPRPRLGGGRNRQGARRDRRRRPPITVTLGGQVETMRESFTGCSPGWRWRWCWFISALVIKFQSWLDPLIVLAAVPFALGGVMWMLYLTQTHISVPALMGTLMCIGLTTANSILVVTSPTSGWRPATTRRRRRSPPATRDAARADDRRRHDPGNDPDGSGRRRRRRAECASGPRGHRRAFVRHGGDPDFRSGGLSVDAFGKTQPSSILRPAPRRRRRNDVSNDFEDRHDGPSGSVDAYGDPTTIPSREGHDAQDLAGNRREMFRTAAISVVALLAGFS